VPILNAGPFLTGHSQPIHRPQSGNSARSAATGRHRARTGATAVAGMGHSMVTTSASAMPQAQSSVRSPCQHHDNRDCQDNGPD
jgi:hypothetical protein